MAEQGKSHDVATDVLGDKEDGMKAVFQRILELFRKGGNLFLTEGRKLFAQNLLDLYYRPLVGRKYRIVDPSNPEHRNPPHVISEPQQLL